MHGNDVERPDFITHQTTYPNDDVNGNTLLYLTQLPAIMRLKDASNVYECSQNFYGGSNSLAPPTLPDVTETQQFVSIGDCGGNSINVEHTYDAPRSGGHRDRWR